MSDVPADPCYFCLSEVDDRDPSYSYEFDTYVHDECVLDALSDPNRRWEAQIIVDELGLNVN